MPKLVRALRITFTAACGVACLLLLGLCVRSYTTCDAYVALRSGTAAGGVSMEGQLYLFGKKAAHLARWRKITMPVGEVSFLKRAFMSDKLYFRVAPGSVFIVATHGLAVAVILALVALCWVPWTTKFNLRAILLATALVAVVLGAAIRAIK